MLTNDQEKWIAQLSKDKIIKIYPYDPRTKKIFNKIKKDILKFIGNDTEIFHRGSTALEILGQGEIDVYIPVNQNVFNEYLEKLIKYFGNPGSIYDLKRARFIKYVEGIKVEIFLINKDDESWDNLLKFENYLIKNKKALGEYIGIKKESNGLTVQEYYRKKIEFINKIINKKDHC